MPAMVSCQHCNKDFNVNPAYLKRGGGKYCSYECSNAARSKKVKRECLTCGKQFNAFLSEAIKGKGKYCSVPCFNKAQTQRIKKLCPVCGKVFNTIRSKMNRITCENGKCRYVYFSGERHPNWKGGLCKIPGGYVQVTSKTISPTRDRYHRLVVEQYLNRKLSRGEVVHHIDGDKSNNLLSNLMVFESNSDHIKWHAGNTAGIIPIFNGSNMDCHVTGVLV